jgi:hypothetical protein
MLLGILPSQKKCKDSLELYTQTISKIGRQAASKPRGSTLTNGSYVVNMDPFARAEPRGFQATWRPIFEVVWVYPNNLSCLCIKSLSMAPSKRNLKNFLA